MSRAWLLPTDRTVSTILVRVSTPRNRPIKPVMTSHRITNSPHPTHRARVETGTVSAMLAVNDATTTPRHGFGRCASSSAGGSVHSVRQGVRIPVSALDEYTGPVGGGYEYLEIREGRTASRRNTAQHPSMGCAVTDSWTWQAVFTLFKTALSACTIHYILIFSSECAENLPKRAVMTHLLTVEGGYRVRRRLFRPAATAAGNV